MLEQLGISPEDLELEVAELRERLGRNSQNSSKPPSSNPPKASPPVQAKTGKAKRRGQPGHRGKRRQLLPVERVDHIVDIRPVDCAQCGQLLLGEDHHPLRRQISELPPTRAVVSRRQAESEGIPEADQTSQSASRTSAARRGGV